MVGRFERRRADNLLGLDVHHIMGVDELIANDRPDLSRALSGRRVTTCPSDDGGLPRSSPNVRA